MYRGAEAQRIEEARFPWEGSLHQRARGDPFAGRGTSKREWSGLSAQGRLFAFAQDDRNTGGLLPEAHDDRNGRRDDGKRISRGQRGDQAVLWVQDSRWFIGSAACRSTGLPNGRECDCPAINIQTGLVRGLVFMQL